VPDNGFSDIAKEANALAKKKKPGRPKGSGGPQSITRRQVQKARELFEPLVQKAYDRLENILNDDDIDPAVHLRAVKEVLDRRYGTPVSTQIVEKTINDERRSPVSDAAISSQDTETLMKLSKMLSDFVEREEKMVDITPDYPEK
jgi:hypothetical protein